VQVGRPSHEVCVCVCVCVCVFGCMYAGRLAVLKKVRWPALVVIR